MKNYIKNILKGSLVMMAIVAAFAFTNPVPQLQTVWGYDEISDEMVPVTLGSNEYDCNLSITETCVYLDEQRQNPHPQSPNGKFELN
ncbi:hypothetical protein [Fontibacter flavus]|uniref:NVEALA protein n=1 Tax=Fontibacter flavus TaxID=654838 RepID=A0ABV6FP40_9BACT